MKLPLLILGLLCALFGVWLTSAELFAAPRTAAAAGVAARIGVIRGDLWARVAANLGRENQPNRAAPGDGGIIEAAKAAVESAPLRADAWLLLARAVAENPPVALSALEMSYFTGPGQARLVEGRLAVASTLGAINDPNIQDQVRLDIMQMVKTPARGTLAGIYLASPTQSRAALAQMILDADPAFRLPGNSQAK